MIEYTERPGGLTPVLAAGLAWLRSSGWIVGWWLVGRGLVFATALVIHAVGPAGFLRLVERDHTLGVLEAWDGRWYRMVASSGYLLVPGKQSDPAFFPLFPLLLRAVHLLGIGYAAGGLVLANVGLVVALVAFRALTSELFGAAFSRRAVVYLAIFPFGYVFSMDYPESIVLALIVLAAIAAIRGRWLTAAICASVGALGRPEALFVVPPLAALAWQQRRRLTTVERGYALTAIVGPAATFASFPLYLDRVLHDPLAWSQAQRAWGRHFTIVGVFHAVAHLGAAYAHSAWVVRDVSAAAIYLVLLWLARRAGTPGPWLLMGLAIVVLPVFSGSFDSIGRFGLLAPALYWGLAALGCSRRTHLAIIAGSSLLLITATATIPLIFP